LACGHVVASDVVGGQSNSREVGCGADIDHVLEGERYGVELPPSAGLE